MKDDRGCGGGVMHMSLARGKATAALSCVPERTRTADSEGSLHGATIAPHIWPEHIARQHPLAGERRMIRRAWRKDAA